MLEHMTFEDANFVIKECYRCLCKRGIIRIIVPDLYEITKKYIDLQSIHPKGSNTHNFLRDLNIFREQHTDIKKIIYEIFSHSKHLYMYDEWSLRELLEKHGFYGCQKMNYGQSRISDIRLIESEERHKMSICLEGVKE
jgi:predicted SAM-dependent methyltransferase